MFDERTYERAARLEQQERDAAIARQRALMQPATPSPDGNCIDCGDPIPAGRLAAKPDAARCTECQEHEDQKIRNARW
ncbi:MAG: TraR/DksA C4-type zinc finger protein [Aquisalimonadaceae bacterium]